MGWGTIQCIIAKLSKSICFSLGFCWGPQGWGWKPGYHYQEVLRSLTLETQVALLGALISRLWKAGTPEAGVDSMWRRNIGVCGTPPPPAGEGSVSVSPRSSGTLQKAWYVPVEFWGMSEAGVWHLCSKSKGERWPMKPMWGGENDMREGGGVGGPAWLSLLSKQISAFLVVWEREGTLAGVNPQSLSEE